MGLLGLAGIYFSITHGQTPRGWAALVPKEAAVASLFALGSSVFVLTQIHRATGFCLVAVAGFAVLCFLNCGLITRWEGNASDLRDPSSLLNAFPQVVRHLDALGISLAVFSLMLSLVIPAPIFLPIATAALLLVALDLRRSRFSAAALRVLADVALLPPLLFLWAA